MIVAPYSRACEEEVNGSIEEFEGWRRGMLITGEWYNPVSNMLHHVYFDFIHIHLDIVRQIININVITFIQFYNVLVPEFEFTMCKLYSKNIFIMHILDIFFVFFNFGIGVFQRNKIYLLQFYMKHLICFMKQNNSDNFEQNRILFGSKSKRSLSPQSHFVKFERKLRSVLASTFGLFILRDKSKWVVNGFGHAYAQIRIFYIPFKLKVI